MPLTPEDVSNKRFTAVRLREGYDMTEVDQFLDEVESELSRLHRENEELRARAHTADAAGPATNGRAADGTAAVVRSQPQPQPQPQPAVGPTGVETIRVTTTAEASSAAARLLELATGNAEQLVDEATAQAMQIRTDAQSEAERLDAESRTSAERLEAEARSRAQRLDAETAQRRQQLFGDLERQRVALDSEIERLRTFEREYRAELKSYFQAQLQALDAQNEEGLHGYREAGARSSDGSARQENGSGSSQLQSVLNDSAQVDDRPSSR